MKTRGKMLVELATQGSVTRENKIRQRRRKQKLTGVTSTHELPPIKNKNDGYNKGDDLMNEMSLNNQGNLNEAATSEIKLSSEADIGNTNEKIGLTSPKKTSQEKNINGNKNDELLHKMSLNNADDLTEVDVVNRQTNKAFFDLGENDGSMLGPTSPKVISQNQKRTDDKITQVTSLNNTDDLKEIALTKIKQDDKAVCQSRENDDDEEMVFEYGASDSTLTWHSSFNSDQPSSSSDIISDSFDGSDLSSDCFTHKKRKQYSPLFHNLTNCDTENAEQSNKVSSSNVKMTTECIITQADESGSTSSDNGAVVQIRHSKKNKFSGKRKRDKRHCCYICQTLFCNLPRHFERVHHGDVDISKIMSLPKGSKQRRKEYARLQHIGDFYHNCEVLRLKKGELILVRVPTPIEIQKYTYVDYGPCPDCLGFMLKKNITSHVKRRKCIEHKSTEGRNCLSECNSLLNGICSSSLSETFITYILNKLKADEVSQTCKDDALILKFGNMMFEKYDISQSEWIRQSMRQLGRLVIQMRNNSPNNILLSECLIPQNFDNIVDATKALCSVVVSSSSRPEFKTPSLGLKIGYNLRKCISIARGEALRQGNMKRNKDLLAFLSIMDLEWNIKISSNALNSLYKRKFNSSQLLPLTEDLIRLNKYLQSEMSKSKEVLKNKPSPTNYTQFASILLCRLVLFNKRRSGETAKMTIQQYMMRPLWSDQTTEELKKSLSKFETTLAEKMVVVDIEGKRGRKVPIILTPDLRSGVDLLISLRTACGISSKNPFIFARSQDSISHLRGHDCIKRFVKCADLREPDNINVTKLRKYIATVCQIFNMTENETDWLAKHLGHDIRIHREFYRLHESAVELTKVSRLLLAVDKGEAKSFAGKTLDEIEIEDLPNLGDDEISDEDKVDEENELWTEKSLPSTSGKRPIVTSEREEKQQKKICKRPWALKESEAVLKFFRQNVSKEIVPRKAECEKCLQKYPVLDTRRWTDIKFYIKNHIQKIRKQKKGHAK